MINANGKRYVIETVEAEKQTAGGIYVSNTDETQFARIKDVGTGIETPLAVGAVVVVNWNKAFPVKSEGRRVFLIDHDEILGVLTNG